MKSTKDHITRLVRAYIIEHPVEYDIFKKGVAMTRSMTKDEFAELEGSSSTRALFEMPQELYEDLVIGLSEEEMQWFKTLKGSHWFARTFKDFTIAKSI